MRGFQHDSKEKTIEIWEGGDNPHEQIQEKGDQGLCGIGRLIFTSGIFCGYDGISYAYRFCYHTKAEAQLAFDEWSGKEGTEPEGFIVRKG